MQNETLKCWQNLRDLKESLQSCRSKNDEVEYASDDFMHASGMVIQHTCKELRKLANWPTTPAFARPLGCKETKLRWHVRTHKETNKQTKRCV